MERLQLLCRFVLERSRETETLFPKMKKMIYFISFRESFEIFDFSKFRLQ